MSRGRRLGTCPREATDAVQDILQTTRPVAEKTLFAMMERGAVVLRGAAYVLVEDEAEVRKEARKVSASAIRNRNTLRIGGMRGRSQHHSGHHHQGPHRRMETVQKGQNGWDVDGGAGTAGAPASAPSGPRRRRQTDDDDQKDAG